MHRIPFFPKGAPISISPHPASATPNTVLHVRLWRSYRTAATTFAKEICGTTRRVRCLTKGCCCVPSCRISTRDRNKTRRRSLSLSQQNPLEAGAAHWAVGMSAPVYRERHREPAGNERGACVSDLRLQSGPALLTRRAKLHVLTMSDASMTM